MRFLMTAALLVATSAQANNLSARTDVEQAAIMRAATILATSSVCRNVRPFSDETPAHLAAARRALEEARLPTEEIITEITSSLDPSIVVSDGFEAAVCYAVLSPRH